MTSIVVALETLPVALRETVQRQWDDFDIAMTAAEIRPPVLGDEVLAELCRVWACSEFVAQRCVCQPPLLLELLDNGDLQHRYAADEMQQHVQATLQNVTDAESLARQLRRVRQREMLRIAWRDISQAESSADLNQTMADVSALADACIQGALAWLQNALIAEWGEPKNAAGVPQQMLVLGMGKLGAGELNFSSDVDLIFVFPETGSTTKGASRHKSNEQFFIRLGQQLVRALDENTADGFVFRVDMRLRPFGQSGALACSFAALENYYQSHGRDWERYALIKARVVAGDAAAGEQLFDILRPFVFRRYLDYGAFEALREMKKMVAAEVKRKGMANHVKLGAGGIREVEFIGQAFQLVRGGREPELQRRDIQGVLRWLEERNYLPGYVVQQLQEAYEFLRDTEHRLQEYQDQQTHQLPDDEPGQQRLAFSMGFEDWDEFLPVLRGHMARVHSHFEQVFESPQNDHAETDDSGLSALWLGNPTDAEAESVLLATGYDQPAACWSRLQVLKTGRNYHALSPIGRTRMDRLLPLLLGAVVTLESRPDSPHNSPYDVLLRLLALVEAVARRSAYLSLLSEHPMALSQLVRLCAASPWIAQQLVQSPLLLDELLDPRSLYRPPDRSELAADLQRRLKQVPDGDLEQAMDSLRQFKQVSVLRVAAADVMEAVPLSRPISGPLPSGAASASQIAPGDLVMQVSDHLTIIAELVLQAALELAWDYLIARHGRPACVSNDDDGEKGFVIIAYGKLGGIELGYGSDLDLVFLHNAGGHAAKNQTAVTDGDKPVADNMFYARLGQRIIHILTVHTSAGTLYETDMRLRPSGESGLLVTSLASFSKYQHNKAWTWEHQALVRARVVAGDVALKRAFDVVRREVLALPRDSAQLKKDIVEMRERMRESLNRAREGEFDLKQGGGGIADIEFMVQFGVLNCAHLFAESGFALSEFTDNVRLLDSLAEQGLMPPEDAHLLADIYRRYRAEVHRFALQELRAVVAIDRFVTERESVQRIWQQLLVS